nr:alpha/beta fold hydrolase [Legionella jordanis]
MINTKKIIEEDAKIAAFVLPLSEIVNTPKGKIEILHLSSNFRPAKSSDAPTILLIHGAIGGHDQSVWLFDFLFGLGFNVLGLSRPGYCRTPLAPSQTFVEQADLIAAVLDELGINQVIAIGLSAGGPTLYQLAIRHPDKVKALVAINCISRRFQILRTIPKFMPYLLGRVGSWFLNQLVRLKPVLSAKLFLKINSLLSEEEIEARAFEIATDPARFKYINRFYKCILQFNKLRKNGVNNDLKQVRDLKSLALKDIKCPSLIIHGTADAAVLFYDGLYAASCILKAKPIWIEEGSHFGLWLSPQAKEIQSQLIHFVKQYGDSNESY